MASKPKSTPRKSTAAGRTRKTSTPRLRAVTAAPEAEAETPDATAAAPEAAPASGEGGPARRGDLLSAVAARTALKRSDVKAVMDLVLEEIGRSLDANDSAALAPLGKLVVKKRVTRKGGDVLTLKLNRSASPARAKDDAAEDTAGDAAD